MKQNIKETEPRGRRLPVRNLCQLSDSYSPDRFLTIRLCIWLLHSEEDIGINVGLAPCRCLSSLRNNNGNNSTYAKQAADLHIL